MSKHTNRIVAWHEGVYGPNRRPLVVAKKLLEEASECHIEAKSDPIDWDSVMNEVADCVIVCEVLAGLGNKDIDEFVERKLEKLEARTRDEQLQRDDDRGVERTAKQVAYALASDFAKNGQFDRGLR